MTTLIYVAWIGIKHQVILYQRTGNEGSVIYKLILCETTSEGLESWARTRQRKGAYSYKEAKMLLHQSGLSWCDHLIPFILRPRQLVFGSPTWNLKSAKVDESFLYYNQSFKCQPYKLIKRPQIFLRPLPTNCLSRFDHFVELALRELKLKCLLMVLKLSKP